MEPYKQTSAYTTVNSNRSFHNKRNHSLMKNWTQRLMG